MSQRFEVQSVAELRARLQVERAGVAFVLFRNGAGEQQIVTLADDLDSVPLGREVDPGIQLSWDPRVSRLHATIERVGGAWTVVDDGLSRNGTFVNGVPVAGRRRLMDGDAMQLGDVLLEFRDPGAQGADETLKASTPTQANLVTPAQHRVLVALCRPLRDPPFGPPASNKQIAAELTLTVDAVKTHLRRVAEALEVDNLPQNAKRAQLAWKAMNSGVVTARDLMSSS
jgi:pSer/pThr/pTyr-binding forkhead associated (FHA) protein